MKAAILHSQGQVNSNSLIIKDVERPQPGSQDVLLKVKACAVCRTDLHIVEGDLKAVRLPLIIDVKIGDRVGVPWLYWACGKCKYCNLKLENLCDKPLFTGYSVNGGFAEYMLAKDHFIHRLPGKFDDVHVAPLLCGGAIGYRSLKLTGLLDKGAGRLGIFGFGSAAHLITPVAIRNGLDVYVFTRGVSRQELGLKLGAKWAGEPSTDPGTKLDAAIIFAPAGWIVIEALKKLDKAGKVIIGEIHMSPIEKLDYSLIWLEREIKSVANVTRADVREFLEEAVKPSIQPDVNVHRLEDANQALQDLKNGSITGSAVLKIS
jgi:propanol-preferring alcohol dehydrogenase